MNPRRRRQKRHAACARKWVLVIVRDGKAGPFGWQLPAGECRRRRKPYVMRIPFKHPAARHFRRMGSWITFGVPWATFAGVARIAAMYLSVRQQAGYIGGARAAG